MVKRQKMGSDSDGESPKALVNGNLWTPTPKGRHEMVFISIESSMHLALLDRPPPLKCCAPRPLVTAPNSQSASLSSQAKSSQLRSSDSDVSPPQFGSCVGKPDSSQSTQLAEQSMSEARNDAAERNIALARIGVAEQSVLEEKIGVAEKSTPEAINDYAKHSMLEGRSDSAKQSVLDGRNDSAKQSMLEGRIGISEKSMEANDSERNIAGAGRRKAEKSMEANDSERNIAEAGRRKAEESMEANDSERNIAGATPVERSNRAEIGAMSWGDFVHTAARTLPRRRVKGAWLPRRHGTTDPPSNCSPKFDPVNPNTDDSQKFDHANPNTDDSQKCDPVNPNTRRASDLEDSPKFVRSRLNTKRGCNPEDSPKVAHTSPDTKRVCEPKNSPKIAHVSPDARRVCESNNSPKAAKAITNTASDTEFPNTNSHCCEHHNNSATQSSDSERSQGENAFLVVWGGSRKLPRRVNRGTWEAKVCRRGGMANINWSDSEHGDSREDSGSESSADPSQVRRRVRLRSDSWAVSQTCMAPSRNCAKKSRGAKRDKVVATTAASHKTRESSSDSRVSSAGLYETQNLARDTDKRTILPEGRKSFAQNQHPPEMGFHNSANEVPLRVAGRRQASAQPSKSVRQLRSVEVKKQGNDRVMFVPETRMRPGPVAKGTASISSQTQREHCAGRCSLASGKTPTRIAQRERSSLASGRTPTRVAQSERSVERCRFSEGRTPTRVAQRERNVGRCSLSAERIPTRTRRERVARGDSLEGASSADKAVICTPVVPQGSQAPRGCSSFTAVDSGHAPKVTVLSYSARHKENILSLIGDALDKVSAAGSPGPTTTATRPHNDAAARDAPVESLHEDISSLCQRHEAWPSVILRDALKPEAVGARPRGAGSKIAEPLVQPIGCSDTPGTQNATDDSGQPEISPLAGFDSGQPEISPLAVLDSGKPEISPLAGLDSGKPEISPQDGLDPAIEIKMPNQTCSRLLYYGTNVSSKQERADNSTSEGSMSRSGSPQSRPELPRHPDRVSDVDSFSALWRQSCRVHAEHSSRYNLAGSTGCGPRSTRRLDPTFVKQSLALSKNEKR